MIKLQNHTPSVLLSQTNYTRIDIRKIIKWINEIKKYRHSKIYKSQKLIKKTPDPNIKLFPLKHTYFGNKRKMFHYFKLTVLVTVVIFNLRPELNLESHQILKLEPSKLTISLQTSITDTWEDPKIPSCRSRPKHFSAKQMCWFNPKEKLPYLWLFCKRKGQFIPWISWFQVDVIKW